MYSHSNFLTLSDSFFRKETIKLGVQLLLAPVLLTFKNFLFFPLGFSSPNFPHFFWSSIVVWPALTPMQCSLMFDCTFSGIYMSAARSLLQTETPSTPAFNANLDNNPGSAVTWLLGQIYSKHVRRLMTFSYGKSQKSLVKSTFSKISTIFLSSSWDPIY